MSASPDAGAPAGSVGDRVRTVVRDHPVVVAVLALTVIGLAARLAFLGWRVAHWDEARVAYWVDYAAETGHFAYNSHTHGPFVQHAARYLFGIFGANDFAARLPVALIGGLLPLTALLYREHLRDVEVVVMAGFLTANPVLLYYSRFMRSDLLVATFMFAAFGLLVRFYDTRRLRYVYGATALLTLGIASKENAPLYVLTWLGAGALCLDAALYRPRKYERGLELLSETFWARARVVRTPEDALGAIRDRLWYLAHAVGLVVVFLAVFVFMFAPRGGGIDGMLYPPAGAGATLGLWEAVTAPWKLPGLVSNTIGHVFAPSLHTFPFVTTGGGEYWAFGGNFHGIVIDLPGPPPVDGTSGTVPYLDRLGGMVNGLWFKSLPLVAFAVIGFLRERYAAATSRTLVLFMFYAGVASLFGYPLVFSIGTGWKWGMTHVVVPLAIPAAVGLGIVGRWGLEGFRHEDRIDLGLSALVIGAVAVLVVSTAVAGAYAPHDRSGDNPLVQYGQPGDDLRPALERIEDVAPAHEGVDVVFYDGDTAAGGSFLREDPESAAKTFRPVCTEWGNTLPLNWYVAAYDAETACENETAALRERTSGDDPVPVVITRESDVTVPDDHLDQHYRALTYRLRTHGSEATFWIHEDWASQ